MIYKNPIIFADYSDPDVIRVGDTYYLTASSFNYVPGLPILVSKDLVNWELKNYALKNIQYDNYKIPQHSKGVWAPSIRFHEGTFYICYGMPDEGIFMVTTDDPLGQWSEPVLVMPGKGLIDSCPFWDEDGRAYIIHGYAKSRIGFNSVLGIFEITPDGKKKISEDRIIFDGRETQHTIEGPKVYKKDDFYYILAPAGGVRTGWQTALRSKNIYGPYEEKIVMQQGETEVNGPHQGGLVDTPDGKEWFLHFQDMGFYGRICHLQPVVWEDSWPVMGNNGEPVMEIEIAEPKPMGGRVACGAEGESLCGGGSCGTGFDGRLFAQGDGKDADGVALSHDGCMNQDGRFFPTTGSFADDFKGSALNPVWQWMGNWEERFYSLDNGLRLNALNPAAENGAETILWNEANVLTQKLIYKSFECKVNCNFENLKSNEMAGFIMNGGTYVSVAVRNAGGKKEIILIESAQENGANTEKITMLASADNSSSIEFSAKLRNDFAGNLSFRLFYQLDSCDKVEVETSFRPVDHTWTGSKLGMFAVALDDKKHEGFASFKNFEVCELR